MSGQSNRQAPLWFRLSGAFYLENRRDMESTDQKASSYGVRHIRYEVALQMQTLSAR